MARDFHLKFPQWSGGDWVVGLGSYLFRQSNVIHVYCDYRRKSGSKLWDGYKVCTKAFAEKYPLTPLKSNPSVKLYRIPFGELETHHEEYMDKEAQPVTQKTGGPHCSATPPKNTFSYLLSIELSSKRCGEARSSSS